MKNEFVSYNQAIQLRLLGIDEICFTHYWGEQFLNENIGGWMKNSNTKYIMAPLKQQVFRWFCQKYNLFSEILLDKTTYPKFCFEIHKYQDFGNWEKVENTDWCLYISREEAESACIDKLIEIIKEK
jgi:hypothetical protein